jgi:hypothetical protein
LKLLVFKSGVQITCCPKCESDVFYVEVVVSGRSSWRRSLVTGENDDNTEFWQHFDTKELKTAFCGNCSEKLGSVKDAVSK